MLAIEMGSNWIRGARRGEAPSFAQPCLIARDANSLKEIAHGQQALQYAGGATSLQIVRPFRCGRILDWEGALSLLRLALKALHPRRGRPPLALAVAADLSLVQRRAWKQLAQEAGAGETRLFESPLCAAYGCGCDVSRPLGRAVLHWGGSTFDVGLLAGGQVLYGESVALGGLDLDLAVERAVRKHHGLLISPVQAEEVKCQLLSALNQDQGSTMDLTGFGVIDGLPRSLQLSQQSMQGTVEPFLLQVREVVLRLLSQATPEVCGDILQEGLWLCGGSSQLRGLQGFIEQISGLRVLPVEKPEQAAIRGLSEWIRLNN